VSRVARRSLLVMISGSVTACLALTVGFSSSASAVQQAGAIPDVPGQGASFDNAGLRTAGGSGIDEGIAAAFDQRRAQERGVSVEQVRADDEAGAELGMLAAQLEGEFPDLYIQSEWRYTEYPNAQVVLASEPPEAVRHLIDTAPFPVGIVVASDGPDRWEAMEIVEEMQSALTADSGLTSVGSYDPLTGTYNLTVEGPRPDAGVLQQVTGLAGGQAINLEFGDDASRAEPAYVGGEGGFYGCTAGFVVRNGPTFGISTANHCPVPETTFTYKGVAFGWGGSLDRDYGDAQWGWSAGGTPLPMFRQTALSVLTARGIVGPYIGLGHCTYGMTTRTSCATVVGLNTVVNYGPADGTYRNLVRDGGDHVDHGDSGGPNFGTGGQVLGYTSGFNSDYSFWTASSALHNFAYVTAFVD
jgi:hypothetical protein